MRGFLERVAALRDEQQMDSFDWRHESNVAQNLSWRNRGTARYPDRRCLVCGEEFHSLARPGKQIYCSRECYRARKVKGQLMLVLVGDAVDPTG